MRQKRKKRKLRFRRFLLFLGLTLCAFSVLHIYANRILPSPSPTEYQISYNRTARRRAARDIQYIVIHDTANKERGADAMHHYQFFNSGNQSSSADFFVDDRNILKVNDFYSYYTWHCGDGGGKNGITNQNSIGVEICINRDGNYRQAVANAEELVRNLMKELDIDTEHVVRHFDASGKNCPATMQNSSWKEWNHFKEALNATEHQ